MIPKASWRAEDARPLDDGVTRALTLSATDSGSVAVLHLDPGGATDRHAVGFGQLVIVTAGTGTVEVGSESVTVGVGDVVRWPRDVVHRLSTDHGVSALVVTYAEEPGSWRVSRRDERGDAWTVGVFKDTERARQYKQRLADEGWDARLE